MKNKCIDKNQEITRGAKLTKGCSFRHRKCKVPLESDSRESFEKWCLKLHPLVKYCTPLILLVFKQERRFAPTPPPMLTSARNYIPNMGRDVV